MQHYVWYNNELVNDYVRRLYRKLKQRFREHSQLLKIGDNITLDG